MKLEVGMYVRTKRDGIGKIISLSIGEEDECCFIELSKRRTGIKEHNIIKASHNIIDLIEVGDYVNGCNVDCINYDLDKDEDIVESITLILPYQEDKEIIYNDDIKSIVTHEQIESMSYKVEDK